MSDLEARIAEVLGAHLEHHGDEYDLMLSASIRKLGAEVAAMLAPVIREREAEAWEEGYIKSCFDHGDGGKLHGANNINPYKESNDV